MPCAFVVFLESSGDRLGPSRFHASRKQKHAGRIPEHGSHIARVMRILRGYEFRKEANPAGEREAQFEAEWSKQERGWRFGRRVVDA